ncbi:type III-A CRISPR-associated protein Csm2 [Phorcysia thermohydrogeniphila]|uniref:CRISPR system Cms protein Csm2 n=1 Tax=Phorcysia thermohydrogeniphila TaxID=936138 RepID=A0A4R1GJR9_9BACT|nr:type III-A CRISPR-associated protein Csm2 [Phorcysia thermohydrogeniphila]TCK06219.1 CRISPR type III-A-associated protein Csm2 [Phorcysia thermohydrogeniphila]
MNKEILCPNRPEDREKIFKARKEIKDTVTNFMEGKARPEILLETIEEIATVVSGEAIDCKFQKGKVKPVKISFTKIRKYYEQYLEIYERCLAAGKRESLETLLLKLYMIKSYLAYDRARKKINSTFEEFLTTLITNVNSEEDLKNGKLLFEAFVGFIRGILETTKEG